MMLKLKFQSFGHLMWTADSLGKSLMPRKDCGRKEKRASEDEMLGWHHQCNGTNLGKLWEMVRDREAWCTAAHGVAKRQTRLGNNSNNISNHTMHFFISPPSAHSLRVCTYWLLPNVSPSMRACCVLRAACAQSCLTLCGPMDSGLPGSRSVQFSRKAYWSGLPFCSPRGLTDPAIKPAVSCVTCPGWWILSH